MHHQLPTDHLPTEEEVKTKEWEDLQSQLPAQLLLLEKEAEIKERELKKDFRTPIPIGYLLVLIAIILLLIAIVMIAVVHV